MIKNDITAAGYRPPRKLAQLKADYLAAMIAATDNGRHGVKSAAAALGPKYEQALYFDGDYYTDEAAGEYIGIITALLELGAGRFELTQKGGNTWIGNGFYSRAGKTQQYKRGTYNARRELKALGCCWSSKNGAWYYNRETVKRRAQRAAGQMAA